jgi:hypothetical protein
MFDPDCPSVGINDSVSLPVIIDNSYKHDDDITRMIRIKITCVSQ